MITNEAIETILQIRKEESVQIHPKEIDVDAANETAQLISGSFTYSLYESLREINFEMDAITKHIESMYDSSDYFGFIYFILLLADTLDYDIPVLLVEMSANDMLLPIITAAIIEDWLEYHNEYEEV